MANIFKAVWHHKIISVIVIALLVAGYFYFINNAPKTTVTAYNYGTVTKGMISQSVSGSGQVSVTNQTAVKSKVDGDVTAVEIVAGQSVKEGDALARLDSTDAQKTLRDAQLSLDSANLSFEKLKKDNSLSLSQAQDAITTAQQALKNSEDNLNQDYSQGFTSVANAFLDFPSIMTGLDSIVNGGSSFVVQSSPTYLDYYYTAIKDRDSSAINYLNDAALAYQKAKARYDANFQDYKKASRFSDPAVIEALVNETYETSKSIAEAIKNTNNLIQRYEDLLIAQNVKPQTFADTHLSSLSSYTTKNNSYLAGLLAFEQTIQGDKNAIASGTKSIEEKKQTLSTLQDLSNPYSVQSQEMTISQKESAVEDAKKNLEYFVIKAPFDGIVASVDVKKGDSISANAAISTIITTQQIAEVSLNEVDIASVKIGQKAILTFDAVSDLTLTGHVTEVDTIGTVSQGVVSYNATVTFDTQDDRIKPGMSAAAIITVTKQDVLLVPNAAVKSNAGGNYVEIPVQSTNGATTGNSGDGQTVTKQTVTVGLSDDNYTEIVSGLNEGDSVVIKTSTQQAKTPTAAATTPRSGGSVFQFFGGGGPGR